MAARLRPGLAVYGRQLSARTLRRNGHANRKTRQELHRETRSLALSCQRCNCFISGEYQRVSHDSLLAHHAVTLAAALSVVGIVRAEPPDSPVKSDAASCTRPDFHVVLDVGHTAKSPGAKSARGADEFDFNLRLAKK